MRGERFLAVIGAAALFVMGTAVATQASNGSLMKIGSINKGTRTTSVQITSGAASPVTLLGRRTSAPFVTNMTGQVANLNASKVGGATLVPKSFALPASAIDGYEYAITGLAAGTYLAYLSASVDLTTAGSTAVPNVFSCVLGYYDIDPITMLQSESVGVGQYFYASLSATKVVSISAGQTLVFVCATTAHDGWTATGFTPRVTFQPVPTETITQLTNPTPPPPTSPMKLGEGTLLGTLR